MVKDGDTLTAQPVRAGVDALDETLGDLLDCSLIGLDAAGTRATLVALADVEARMAALRLRVAAHADEVGVGADSGATSTGVWWACATRQARAQAAGQVRLATALASTWTRVGAGLAAGGVHLDQARVLVHALEDLPTDLDPAILAAAEQHLVDLAALHDPTELRRLGRAVLEAVAPQVAEEEEGKRLEAELARAREKTRLTLTPDGHGAVHGRFTVPELHGAILKKALWALASPAHRAAVERLAEDQEPCEASTGLVRPGPKRMGQAFCDLLESLSADDLPQAGGCDATVVITVEHETIAERLSVARLDTGERLLASEARRMACGAGVLPMVMNGCSQVLDAGRKNRFHTAVMRTARGVIDRCCTAEGCDWPPAMCQLHHDEAWAEGGKTDVEHARLLCPHHHRRIHDPRYEHRVLPDNQVRFHRRI